MIYNSAALVPGTLRWDLGLGGLSSQKGVSGKFSVLCAFQVTFGILTENGRDETSWRDGRDNPARLQSLNC